MMKKRRLPHTPEPQVQLRHLVLAALVAVGAWGFLSEGLFESRLATFGVEIEMAPKSGGFITSVDSRPAPDDDPESGEVADALALIEEQAPSPSSSEAPDAVEPEENLDDVNVDNPVEIEDENVTSSTTSTSSTTAAPRSTTAAPVTTTEPSTTTVAPQVTTQPVTVVRPTTTTCLLYTSPSPRDQRGSRMPSSA